MFYVNESLCTGCGACVKSCPTGAIRLSNGHAVIRQDLCHHCAACAQECTHGAIVESREPVMDKTSAPLKSSVTPPLPLRGEPLASPQPLMPAWIRWLSTVAPLAINRMAGFTGSGSLGNGGRGPGRCGRGRRGWAAGIHKGRGRGGCRGRKT